MKFSEKYKLMEVTLDVNDFCNMKCSYCWEQQCKNRLSKENAQKICDRLIDNYNSHKKSNVLRIHFFGGEPLLDWDVLEFIMEYMKDKIPTWFGITTNGTLFSERILKKMKEHNVHTMVSIDGKKERHDANRKFLKGDPTHAIVVSNIKKLIDLGIDFEARMTVTPENAKYVAEDVKYLIEELGIKHISPCPVYDREWTQDQMDDFGKSMEDLYDIYVKNHFDYKSKIYIKFFEDYLFKDLDIKHHNPPCGFGNNTSVAIDTLGNVYPCHQAPTRKDRERFVVGNIIVDESYENDIVHVIRPHTFSSPMCETCPAKETICTGGCPMESWEEHGDLLAPTCETCKFTQLYYKTAKKMQKEKGIPKPISPGERRDFLYSAIMRMLGNIDNIIEDHKNKEYDVDTISVLSQAVWLINEQVLNNKAIHLNTPFLAKEINQRMRAIRAEVVEKNA